MARPGLAGRVDTLTAYALPLAMGVEKVNAPSPWMVWLLMLSVTTRLELLLRPDTVPPIV